MAKRRVTGVVAHANQHETAIVTITQIKVHPLYRKRYHVHRRFAAHNPDNIYQSGDIVQIEEHRPISKTKHWIICKKIGQSEQVELVDIPDSETSQNKE